ncbi:MAG: alginate O-acetyltransferase AlgX-related protein [Gemmataceae bacterium]
MTKLVWAMTKLGQWLLAAGFVGSIMAFSYRSATHVVEHARELPEVVNDSWDETYRRAKHFPQEFEPFFDEHLGWRDIQFRRFARFKMNSLGVSPTPRVWFGDDGWLFYNHEADNTYIPAGDPRLKNRLAEWERAIPEWRTWLAARNIRLLMVVVPDKQSVYTEHLPPLVQKTRTSGTPIDGVIAAWHTADPALDVLDLREPLKSAKADKPLYFQTDTHWTLHGARAAYQSTAHRLGFDPHADSDFHLVEQPKKTGDLGFRLLGYFPRGDEQFDDIQLKTSKAQLVRTYDLNDGFRLDYLKARTWETPESGGGTCMLFHDSFGDFYYSKLLAEHFDRLEAIPSNHLDPLLIERYKPDVVILELVERLFQATGARRPSDPPKRSVTK